MKRRLPNVPLPQRRYVPGTMPHPRHLPQTHIPSPGGASADSLWRDGRWLYGLDLLDAAFYWEAHEVWEELWHTLDRPHPDAKIIQGMIQLSASLLTAELGRSAASTRLFRRARVKLEPGQRRNHPVHVEVSRALERARITNSRR